MGNGVRSLTRHPTRRRHPDVHPARTRRGRPTGAALMHTWYLGIPKPSWLADPRMIDVPVFVSRTTLAARRRLPRAAGRYAVDSGGFTELQRHGRWTITPAQYVEFLRRCWAEIGPFDFAAPMDWMAEPAGTGGGTMGPLRFVGTGLSEV